MDNLKELQNITSKCNVLYVEDDKDIAQALIKYLSRIFKEVVFANDGEEGLNEYQKKRFDLVITDIMMPKMTGLEMTSEIKKINPDQNVIVVSAYSDIDNFLESIKLGIDGYIVKPINYDNMNKTLYKTVSKIKSFKDNKEYQEKLKQFTEVIEKVAIVYKIDENGKITYANDYFYDVSGFSKNEVLSNKQDFLRHPDMPHSVDAQMWDVLKEGNTWEGTLKNKTKDGKAYFLHAIVLPILDNEQNIDEVIAIAFLTTDEETEKREFKKKVMTNYMEFKKTNMNAIQMISSLNKEIDEYKQKYEFSSQKLEKIEKKYNRSERQVSFYEKTIKESNGQQQKIMEMQKNNLQKISESHKKSLQLIEKQKKEIIQLKEEHDLKAKEIVKLSSEVNEQTHIILDLRDTIKNISENNK